MKQIKILNILQYIFIAAYLLIALFCSLGTFEIDMNIQFIKAPDNGFSGNFETDLNFDVSGKIVFGILAICELVLLHVPKVKFSSLNIFICSVRALPSLINCVFALLSVVFGGIISTNLTVFCYLMLLLCVASMTCHIINRKNLMCQKNEQ